MPIKGFGLKPFGFGGFGLPLAPPTPAAVTTLSSSRKIDGLRGRYVANDEGGFEAMDDTAQRVLLVVSFALTHPAFLTARDLAAQEANLRAELGILTSGPEPAIRLLEVSCRARGSDTNAVTIRFKNLLTGTEQSIAPARSTAIAS